jgi:hypothetical protein
MHPPGLAEQKLRSRSPFIVTQYEDDLLGISASQLEPELAREPGSARVGARTRRDVARFLLEG